MRNKKIEPVSTKSRRKEKKMEKDWEMIIVKVPYGDYWRHRGE